MSLKNIVLFFLVAVAGVCFYVPPARAQWDVTDGQQGKTVDDLKDKGFDLKMEPAKQVEMQADQVEYDSGSNVATAKGNVVITSGTTILKADEVALDRAKQDATAKGKVFIDAPEFKVDADAGKFNFVEKTGSFTNAYIANDPFNVGGQKLAKVSDNHMVLEHGYMTTCDHDVPHFRLGARKMDVWAGDKAVARGVKIFVGPVPVMYLPRFTQDLKDKPWFTFVPGAKKDLGFFLLTRSRLKLNENVTTTLVLDAYERQGFGLGTETKYKTRRYGGGLLRTYFINERQIAAKHPWQMKTEPTIQNERYRLEWRHKWDIDNRTTAVWQYYRLSDNILLKKYFEREFRLEPNPTTYFLLTKGLPTGSLSVRVDRRVNRFVSAVDRTPEINYTISSQPISDSGFYLKSNNTASNLVSRVPSPSEDRRKTIRLGTDNEISYPAKLGFVNVTPRVGGDLTYYSRTNDARRPTDILRATFKTGADLSTRFIKSINLQRGLFGSGITRLRHIVAPSVAYKYQHMPTFQASRLNQFDSAIDGLTQEHMVSFALENKLQTKRGREQIKDLVRNLTTVDYLIRQKGRKGRLGLLKNLLEVTPSDWLRMVSEADYDFRNNRLTSHNVDFYITKANRFGISIGDRFARGQDHQLVTQFAYIINPKWRFKIYERFILNTGELKEERYTITRDLHEWQMNLILGNVRGSGTEFLITFSLKAFPDQPLDLLSTSFHQRKAGSQSSVQP